MTAPEGARKRMKDWDKPAMVLLGDCGLVVRGLGVWLLGVEVGAGLE